MANIFPWLQPPWVQLTSYKKASCIPGGMLLMGPAGIGKFDLAKEFAKYVLCRETGDSYCGHCRSCQLFHAGNHPDFFLIEPEEKSTTVKIEQIRELIDSLEQTPVMGGVQIAIISLAEQMNKAASNALLKTLEEPKGQVCIVLLTNQPSLLAATVRSRCQQITLPLPNKTEASKWLTTHLPPDLTDICLSVADNFPLKALSFANADQQELREQLLRSLQQLKSGQVDPIVATTNLTEYPQECLQFLQTLVSDMIRIKFAAKAALLNHRDKISVLTDLCRELSVQKIFLFLDELLEANRLLSFSRNNVNVQLLMEKLFIKWRYNYDAG